MITQQPEPDQIIIDFEGRIFKAGYHQQGFIYPVLTDLLISLTTLKQLLVESKLVGVDKYLELDSVEEVMLMLDKNQMEHLK